jgi:hypothetical protein
LNTCIDRTYSSLLVYLEDQQRLAETFEEFYMLKAQGKRDGEHNKKLAEYIKAVKEIAPTHGKEMVRL